MANFDLVSLFPTPVGMIREISLRNAAWVAFPHTRGDDPTSKINFSHRQHFSPHPWG